MHIHHKELYTLPNPRSKTEAASPRPIVDLQAQKTIIPDLSSLTTTTDKEDTKP